MPRDGARLELLAGPYVDPDVAGAGGAIEPRWEGGRPAWFPRVRLGLRLHVPWDAERTAEVRNLIGCNMSYRRDVLQALNGFRLGYRCDETELVSGSGNGGRTKGWSTFRTRLSRITSRPRGRPSGGFSRAATSRAARRR
jgi:hypothetical protein